MKKINFSTNITVFILFFGIALIQAFQKHDWLEAGLFLLLGLVFAYASLKKS